MAFRSVLSVTATDHSDQDVRTAAGLGAEVGPHLSVLIMSPPPLLMSPPPLGDGIPEWPRHRAHAIAALEKRYWQIERFSQDMANLEKTSREIQNS